METTQDTATPDLADTATLSMRITQLTDALETAHSRENSLRTELAQSRDQFSQYTAQVRQDCETLSDELIQQANNRGWCDVYDGIVDTLNEQFQVLRINEREQEHDVEVKVTVTYELSHTVNVTANSKAQAQDFVTDDPASYVDDYTLRHLIMDGRCIPSDLDVEVL